MNASYDINRLSDDLFRHESGRMIALLTSIFGTENLELSEDVVQETFITAMQVWPLKGLPENPSAWLFRTAKNKAVDILRRNKFSKHIDFSDPELRLLSSAYTLEVQMEKIWNNDTIEDNLLQMMFACCHPDLSMENQVTLILKTLCGFSTSEIANAFLTTEDTISKRLYRAKNFFRERKIKPAFPGEHQLRANTDTVLKTIYLIFNEGYHTSHSDELIREDLLEQAIYLIKLLAAHPNTNLPEVNAATALMLFHFARIKGRTNELGEIVLLEEQDRSTWNRTLIDEGNYYMNLAARGDHLTSYHLEAAIAYEHCVAKNYEDTNWKQILAYYDSLLVLQPGAIIALNRLIAYNKTHGLQQTMREISISAFKPAWENDRLYYTFLGDILATENPDSAYDNYLKAIKLSSSELEQKLLERKLKALRLNANA